MERNLICVSVDGQACTHKTALIKEKTPAFLRVASLAEMRILVLSVGRICNELLISNAVEMGFLDFASLHDARHTEKLRSVNGVDSTPMCICISTIFNGTYDLQWIIMKII